MKKTNRQEVYNKCNGHCGYCGREITFKEMQIDHIIPIYRNDTTETLESWNITRGTDDIDNLLPSCPRCNKWKSTYSLEKFREVIKTSIDRLHRDTPNYRLAKDFGLISENNTNIVFFYETLN